MGCGCRSRYTCSFNSPASAAAPDSLLMGWILLHRLQLHDRAPDPRPHHPAFHIPAVEHEIEQAAGFNGGSASVALDQEVGGPVDVQVGDHPPESAQLSVAQW